MADLSASGFPENAGGPDRSAAGLQYQTYQLGLSARGAALGVGRRVASPPSAQFSNPPGSGARSMSGGQFANGHAKSVVSFGVNNQGDDNA